MGLARSSSRAARAPTAPPVVRSVVSPRSGAAAAHYDQIIDAMNRLPRPALMILTVALFAYAALDPAGFAARMQALSQVPEPLWWMQGAIVTFYFGARESHYSRQAKKPAKPGPKTAAAPETP